MKNKLIAIWRIIVAHEYFLIADNGYMASYKEDDNGTIIREFVKAMKRAKKTSNPDCTVEEVKPHNGKD